MLKYQLLTCVHAVRKYRFYANIILRYHLIRVIQRLNKTLVRFLSEGVKGRIK